MKAKSDNESLIKFINDIDSDAGLWHIIPIPGKEAASDYFEYVFSPLGKVIGMHKINMNMHWFELGYFKRDGKEKTHLTMKGFDRIKDRLMDCTSFEVSKVGVTSVGTNVFMKLGKIVEIPKTVWVKHLKKPLRAHQPSKLSSREETSIAASSIRNVIKNSDEFSNIV